MRILDIAHPCQHTILSVCSSWTILVHIKWLFQFAFQTDVDCLFICYFVICAFSFIKWLLNNFRFRDTLSRKCRVPIYLPLNTVSCMNVVHFLQFMNQYWLVVNSRVYNRGHSFVLYCIEGFDKCIMSYLPWRHHTV